MDLKFSAEHKWLCVDIHVVLPEFDSTVQPGQNFGEVESSKSGSEIYAPIGGVVTTVNEALASQPELNTDPYGDGWICEVCGVESSAFDQLLDAERYRDLVGD